MTKTQINQFVPEETTEQVQLPYEKTEDGWVQFSTDIKLTVNQSALPSTENTARSKEKTKREK